MKYTCINIQGNLISEDILHKIESAEVTGQKTTDFCFEPDVNLRNEIEYAWSHVKLDWKYFSERSVSLPPNDPYGTSLARKWMESFLSTLGFELHWQKSSIEGDNKQSYRISHIADNLDNLPVQIVGFYDPEKPDKCTLDIKSSGGTSRLSPHSSLQEYLNVTEHLFGIATNGYLLRLIRDSGRLVKFTYLEFDLKRMLDDDKYSEFTLLYRLLHSSRFPHTKHEADQCFLEKYYQESIESGNRIRDGLSKAVEESLVALGKGFLQHEKNIDLRNAIKEGRFTNKDYYRELLRLIYRFLFLMVTEERDLIYDRDDKSEDTLHKKQIYLDYYSIERLRKISEINYLYDAEFIDLWQGLLNTFQLFEAGGNGSKLGLKPLDGDLFSNQALKYLQNCQISNQLLLECIRDLNEFEDKQTRTLVSVNYRALDVEELGSVYEGLLDLHPIIEGIENPNPSLINFYFHSGTDRKTTGSYYTRPDLVNELIKSALIPVIEDRLKQNAGNKERQITSLLSLKVCDPAAGSGHFLLAAARTIAWYMARVKTGEENPAPGEFRSSLREVIQHCIYGVDLNPDAVELCKLALWLESHNSGKPLSFLDHKIRCGNSLVGVTDLNVLKEGIPDDAYNAVTGDDKEVCKLLKKDNSNFNKKKQYNLFDLQAPQQDVKDRAGEYHQIETIHQDDVEAVEQARSKFSRLRNNPHWYKDYTACNLWTSAFFFTYTSESQHAAPTSEALLKFIQNPSAAYGPMIGKTNALAAQNKFFHWPLEFPDVFAQGGFDVMLGNPPWERIKFEEKEFFATRIPEISEAKTKAKRTKLIAELKLNKPIFWQEYVDGLHFSEGNAKFIRFCGRFKLTASGDINTYSIFTEHFRTLIHKVGLMSIIAPLGIATDDSTKDFFTDIVQKQKLVSLFGFTNWEFIFPDVGDRFAFCIVTICGDELKFIKPTFAFHIHNINQLNQQERRFCLSKDEFNLINPNTSSCPIFRTEIDATLTKKIYKASKIIHKDIDSENEWGITLLRMFDMSLDSQLFHDSYQLGDVPLYEAKMFFNYDHRYGNYSNEMISSGQVNFKIIPTPSLEQLLDPAFSVKSRFYVSFNDVAEKIKTVKWSRKWFLSYRLITLSVNERTTIASILPYCAVGNSGPLIFFEETETTMIGCALGLFNSLIFDYVARQKVGGTNFSFFIFYQLPMLPKNIFDDRIINEINIKVTELVYTSWDIKAFADDVWKESDEELKAAIKKQWEENKAATGSHTWNPPAWCEIDKEGCPLPPFKWDEERRAILKAELDAIYAKLYGLTDEELRYILDPQDVYGPDFPGETFRVLKEKEIRLYGEYRTKRLVLEAWERMKNGNIN